MPIGCHSETILQRCSAVVQIGDQSSRFFTDGCVWFFDGLDCSSNELCCHDVTFCGPCRCFLHFCLPLSPFACL